MRRLALVGCCKKKNPGSGPAEFIYASRHFRVALAYARTVANDVLILSTRYGAILPSEVIESYDVSFSLNRAATLNPEPASGEWANRVALTLLARGDEHRILLAGQAYGNQIRRLVAIHEEPCRHMRLATRTKWMVEQMGGVR